MIIHPLLRLAVSQPHLLGGHVEGYATLLGEEAKKASSSLALRAGLCAAAGVLAAIGLVLIGVSVLIYAAVSADAYRAGWALVAVPVTPLVIAAVLVWVARSKPVEKAFDAVKRQVQADMDLLREVS
jgi:uncharacterized membrane protein YqjE